MTTDIRSRFSHIVEKPANAPDKSTFAYVMRARSEKFPITALCGYTWVSSPDNSARPQCEACIAAKEERV